MNFGFLGDFIGSQMIGAVPFFGPIMNGADAANDLVENVGDDVSNIIGRVTIIILGFIFVAAGLVMFRPAMVLDKSGDGE